MKRIFKEEGLLSLSGDEAFYYRRENDSLVGCVLTHVDDFFIAGTDQFIESLTNRIKNNLTISKIEDDEFRFTGIDIVRSSEGVTVSMEDFAASIGEIEEVRKGSKTEPLTLMEMKLYRKFTGKVSWLAENCRPDLCYYALEMSKRNAKATLGDLRKINRIVKKIQGRSSKVFFRSVGTPLDLVVFGIGDASYKSDDRAIGGEIVLLGNGYSDRAVPIYWKSKIIRQICHSAKDAETRNLIKLVDTSRFMTDQLEELLFGKKKNIIPIKLFTDSIPTLESIASTKQVEQRLLRNCYTELKDRLEDGDISAFSWLDTDDMVTDLLTKDSK